MSSPARRSGRVPKTKKDSEKDNNRSSTPTQEKKKILSKKGSSAVKQQEDEKSAKREAAAVKEEMATPVRRSGRAPVPSSRFKDMEVLTVSRKRLNSDSAEKEVDSEKPKAKMKKVQKDHSSPSVLPDRIKEDPDVPTPSLKMEEDGSIEKQNETSVVKSNSTAIKTECSTSTDKVKLVENSDSTSEGMSKAHNELDTLTELAPGNQICVTKEQQHDTESSQAGNVAEHSHASQEDNVTRQSDAGEAANITEKKQSHASQADNITALSHTSKTVNVTEQEESYVNQGATGTEESNTDQVADITDQEKSDASQEVTVVERSDLSEKVSVIEQEQSPASQADNVTVLSHISETANVTEQEESYANQGATGTEQIQAANITEQEKSHSSQEVNVIEQEQNCIGERDHTNIASDFIETKNTFIVKDLEANEEYLVVRSNQEEEEGDDSAGPEVEDTDVVQKAVNDDLVTEGLEEHLVIEDTQIGNPHKQTNDGFSSSIEILKVGKGPEIVENIAFDGTSHTPDEVRNESYSQTVVLQQESMIQDGSQLNHIVNEGSVHLNNAHTQLSSSVTDNELVIVQDDGENNLNFRNLNNEHITLTQKDGKTIAILTLPSSSTSTQQHQKSMLQIKNSNTTGVPQVIVSEQNNQNQHGYIVKETPTKNSPFATVVTDDGTTYMNLNPTNFADMLQEKDKAVKITQNSVKGHGRVLKPDSPYNLLLKKSPSPLTPAPVSQVVAPVVKSQSYSLLNPPNLGHNVAVDKKEVNSLPRGTGIHGTIKLPAPTASQNQNVIILSQPPEPSNVEKASSSLSVNSQDLQIVDQETGATPTVIRITKMSNSQTTSEESLPDNILAQHLSSVVSKALGDGSQSTNSASEIIVKPYSDQRKVIVKETVNTDKLIDESKSLEVMVEDSGVTDSKLTEEPSDSGESHSEHRGEIIKESENSENQLESEGNEADFSMSVVAECNDTQDILTDSAESEGDNEEPSSSVSDLTVVKTEPGDNSIEVNGESDVGIDTDVLTKSKLENVGKIKIVENGVEYEVKIVSDDMFEEETKDGEVIFKQEVVEEDGIDLNSSDLGEKDSESSKHTSGTQTIYSSGEVLKRQVFTASQGSIHKLAAVEMKDGQKRQYYYVSVVPNKKFDVRFKSPSPRTPACVVNEEGYYCCDKCNYRTERKANFYKHRRLHTGTKPHTCDICDYKAGTSSNLKRHMGIHEDIRQHKCDICGLCFRQKIHLERHIKYKHEEKRVQCPLCSYVCANEQPDLRMHIKRKHSNATSGEVVICPECNAELSSKKDLKQHMKFHKDGPELKLFCKECSFVTDCQSRLKRHAAIHEKVKPFMCSICQYRAAQKEHVLRHLRTQHKIEVKKEQKRAWTRRKVPDKMYGTAEHGDVKERADFSSGDKIFACNHCTMRFAKLINLYKHLHTQHSDIMPAETEGNYYCVVCEFSTSSKKNLLVHMRRHNLTDQTPPTHVYSCVLCRYVNPKRRNLFQHMKKKHNIDISLSEGAEGEGDETSQEGDTSVVEIKTEKPHGHVTVVSAETDPTSLVVSSTHGQVKVVEESGSLFNISNIASNSSELQNMVDTSNLVIDTRGERERRRSSSKTNLKAHSSHQAIEGLQTLAEQAGLVNTVIEEQVSTEVSGVQESLLAAPLTAENKTIAVLGEAETLSSSLADSNMIMTTEAMTTDVVSGESVEEMVVEEQAASSVELTEEQLSGLSSGDVVEMDGELYLVDMSPDPSGEDKQLLSFIPINNTNVVHT